MQHIKPTDFTGAKAWDALDLTRIDDATVRLHWTNAPYIWHVNDGPEVFVLLSGRVRMHFRNPESVDCSVDMAPGEIFHCEDGDAHRAEPLVPSRILVVERAGSI